MGTPFAEVIGQPIAQSKSPIIHRYWLQFLGLAGDYRRTEVGDHELNDFLRRRRDDPDWRGCNVTIPHKQSVIGSLDRLEAGASTIGAVNCVVREGNSLVGYNSDIDGVAAALGSGELRGEKAALIGCGGGARAVVAYLVGRGVERISVVVRNVRKAEELRSLAPVMVTDILDVGSVDAALGGSAVIVNASPLGMEGAEPMSRPLLDAVERHSANATVFDLVTTPVETPFLAAAKAGGGVPVDGLTMLVGQAARAFELFYGTPAPAPDQKLRDLLTSEESK